MPVKDLYQGIIRDIMAEHGVKPGDAPYRVSANATFSCVLRYTDRYIGKGNDDKLGNRPHYRYNRYKNVLQHLPISENSIIHVDIGCGAGLLSWVLLDWLSKNDVGHNQIDLYGFDHSQAMIKLAGMVRDGLTRDIVDYPDLHYFYDIDALLNQLVDNRCENTDYIITVGHVLVQAQSSCAIKCFTRIVRHVVGLMGTQSKCSLVAVDAVLQSAPFEAGWNSLVGSLRRARIGHRIHINGDSAKSAFLYPA